MVHLDPNSIPNFNVTCHRDKPRFHLIVPLHFQAHLMAFFTLNTERSHTSSGAMTQLRADTGARTPARAQR